MSLQLILGSSGAGKSYMLYEEITYKSIQNPDSNYIIIVPEQFTLQTQKDIVSIHPNHGTMNIDILSFMRLAYRIFDEVGGNDKPVLEDTGKSMILRKVVAKKKKELELFHRDVQKKGFISELKSFISEIYQYSIKEDTLLDMVEAAKNRPMLKSKLNDILVIYRAFNELLSEKYITAEEILDVLCDVIDQSKIIENSVICLDGFTGFTPAQYKLLTILMRKAKKVIITLTLDIRELNKSEKEIKEFELFALTKKTKAKLESIIEEEGIKKDPDILVGIENKEEYEMNRETTKIKAQVPKRFNNNIGLAMLEKNLFRYPFTPYSNEVDNISIHVAKDAKAEASFVIREINHLIRNNGYRYQDIAIITGDITGYGRILSRELEKQGIPVFVDNKREVLSNPLVELIRSVLNIMEENFDYESVFRYLKCGLAKFDKDAIDIMENYVIALGIRGKKRYEEEWTKTYRGQDEGELVGINEIREQFLTQIMPLYEVFKNKEKTVCDFTIALYQFIETMEAREGLNEYLEGFEEENKLLEVKEYEQIYEIIIALLEKLVELLGDEIVSIKEYIEILEAGFEEIKVGLIPPGLDPLVVGDIERTRLKDIKALFFMGVNDIHIPKKSGGGGIISDLERQILFEHQFEMAPTKRQAAYTEQFYLYLNLTKPKERLYVSYSKLGEDGKALRPAYLIDTVKSVLPNINVIDEDEETEEINKVLGSDGGLSYLIEGLRKYPFEEMSDLWKELYTYYSSQLKYEPMLSGLVDSVFYVNKEHGISKEVAKALFGEALQGSVTRFEKFAECAFAHFMNYGLELEERKEYKIAMPDIGNLFHTAIELFSRKLENSEYNWHTISDELRVEWTSECVREACNNYGNAILSSTKRYEYIVKRVERITNRTLWALTEQIKRGDFEPIGFEVLFAANNGLSSLNLELDDKSLVQLRGRIDRLDVYETDSTLMVRVVDYKSGSTSFSLQSLFYGLQIQLALYMNAAIELMNMEHEDKDIIPAGILYYNIDDPFVDKLSNVEDSILKQLKMNGIVNSNKDVIIRHDKSFIKGQDEEEISPSVKSLIVPVETNKDGFLTKRSSVASENELYSIGNFVKKKVKQFGDDILNGDTKIEPYQMDKKSACDYCQYKSICGFDATIEGFKYRKLKSLSKEEIWDQMNEEKGSDNTDEMDE